MLEIYKSRVEAFPVDVRSVLCKILYNQCLSVLSLLQLRNLISISKGQECDGRGGEGVGSRHLVVGRW